MKGTLFKKLVAGALALLMAGTALPAGSDFTGLFGGSVITASAEPYSGQCGENATWTLVGNGLLIIDGSGDMYNYGEKSNTAPWREHSGDIIKVDFSNEITSIGAYAFNGCTALEQITIPAAVTQIGSEAFKNCSALETVTFNEDSQLTRINQFAFLNCSSLNYFSIPANVTNIDRHAFKGCTGMTDMFCLVDIQNTNLSWYSTDSYMDFIPLCGTTCHVEQKYIDIYKGENFSNLNLKFVGNICGTSAYWDYDEQSKKLSVCGRGEMFNFNSDEDLPWYDLRETAKSVEIKEGITTVGSSAFSKCSGLTEATISEGLKKIEVDAFNICNNLKTITLPSSLRTIGSSSFVGCSSLTELIIPEGVTNIHNGAFCYCRSLETVVIPSTVEQIEDEAFYGCISVKDVYCYAKPSLFWLDAECNDFKQGKQTLCHVKPELLDAYNAKFNTGDKGKDINVTFVGDLGKSEDMGLGEHLYGHSISLDGDIGVNFYIWLPTDVLNSETAYVQFSGDGINTQQVYVKDVLDKFENIGYEKYYKFKCRVSAKDMTSVIKAQIVDGNARSEEYYYSVREYAKYILDHSDYYDQSVIDLVKAMLNYGSAAQEYFKNENEENLANEGLDTDYGILNHVSKYDIFSGYTPEQDEKYKVNLYSNSDTTFEGATLSLKSETTLSLYFKSSKTLRFRCTGRTVEKVTTKDGYQIARIRGINAKELDQAFRVDVDDEAGKSCGYVTYSPMTYCYFALDGGTDNTKLQKVCKALYLYSEEAKAYFPNND